MRKTHRHAGGYRSLDCLILTILVGPSLGAKSQNLSAQRGNLFVWAVFDRASRWTARTSSCWGFGVDRRAALGVSTEPKNILSCSGAAKPGTPRTGETGAVTARRRANGVYGVEPERRRDREGSIHRRVYYQSASVPRGVRASQGHRMRIAWPRLTEALRSALLCGLTTAAAAAAT